MVIVVGKTWFRDSYADGRPKFVVRKDMKNGTYQCISEDDMDYNGIVRYYDADQIEALVDREKMWDRLDGQRQGFWASRTVGETLHYHDSFGRYVRGVVVEIDGEYKLKPTALVGKWDAHDLPRRRPNGEINYGYHANKILNQPADAAWQPSDTCVYESPSFSRRQSEADPRNMEAIDLSLPPMTEEEERVAKLEQRIDKIRQVLEERYRNSEAPELTLSKIKGLAE